MISDLQTNPGSALAVPHGTQCAATTPGSDRAIAIPDSRLLAAGLMRLPAMALTLSVTDIKAHLANRTAVAHYQDERGLFDRLPEAQRLDVERQLRAALFVQRLTAGKHGLKVQPACRQALTIHTKAGKLATFRAKYDLWIKTGDWLVFVNRSKAGADWQEGEAGLADAFLEYAAKRIGQFKRADAAEQALLSLQRQWQTGRNHQGIAEVIPGYEQGWARRKTNLIPAGWSTENIRKQIKKRAKLTQAVKALLLEGTASARSHLPQVHSDRSELRFMELVQFDDVRCDFRVLDIVTGQICDLWLLIARDVATSMLLGFGLRPALARDDGSQEHLKLQDMKQLTGWLLETYGLPPYRMTWKIERGTATLSADVRAALIEMLGEDRIDVDYSCMLGGKSATGYWEKKIGNSKGKAMLESLNRLMHMMASHFPGQIGAHYGLRPQQLNAVEAETKEIWTSHRAEDRAELRYPIFTIPQARTKIFEVFQLQNTRTEHTMQGFERVVEWFDGQRWQPGATAPAGTEFPTRTRMESPLERAGRLLLGCAPFTRVSPAIIKAFYEHTQRRRPVEPDGTIKLMHELKTLRFEPVTPDQAIAAGTVCLCYFNPDDPRFLILTDARGGILGTWVRRGLVKFGDEAGLATAIRHTAGALADARARATELAADETEELARMREHNSDFVTVTEPTSPAKVMATSEIADRLAALPRNVKQAARAASDFDARIEAALRKSMK